MKTIPKIVRAYGSISAPPSKSYTARAVVLAAMTATPVTIVRPLDSDDSRYAVEALRKIGYHVSGSLASEITIGERTSMSANEVEVFVGNAGTAMRFLTGFLAFTPGRFLLTGEARMHDRPIADLVGALQSIGAEIEYAGKEGFPPLHIRGKRMRGGFEMAISGAVSSQFVSSLILAGSTLAGGLTLRIESLASKPYVDITRDILEEFGGRVESLGDGRIRVHEARLARDRYEVEGDYSSASYWMAAAAVTGGEVRISGLRESSAQGDRLFIEILEKLGCTASWSEGALVMRGPQTLGGGIFDCNQTPDIVPTLAAIAPFASAPIEIVNIATLRVKESDRIATVAAELRKLGATVEERDDAMVIQPGVSTVPATIETHNDHRIAMSFAIAGLRRGNVSIANEQVVSKSYPRFWKTLDELIKSSES
ncbi:MAG TPA: 3-phosphoshikimate 1-carboxyvinyltransferase [Thermoanaerobaculia bacterium]|nr:3-phosphoshikimate 1-carboxyvinyltransferase [Thermoanaerobaculia bacterium]